MAVDSFFLYSGFIYTVAQSSHHFDLISLDLSRTYTQDGVCLTESGLCQLQSLSATASRRRKPKPKLKLKIINQNSVAVLQAPVEPLSEHSRDEDMEDNRGTCLFTQASYFILNCLLAFSIIRNLTIDIGFFLGGGGSSHHQFLLQAVFFCQFDLFHSVTLCSDVFNIIQLHNSHLK